MIKYRIQLTDSEREALNKIVSKGRHKATDIQKAYVLLVSDESYER